MKMKILFITLLILAIFAAITWSLWPRDLTAPTEETKTVANNKEEAVTVTPTSSPAPIPVTSKNINTAIIAGIDPAFDFTATIPADWSIMAVPESQSISFYDPQAAGKDDLDRSQIFIRSFQATDFLTLSTVQTHSKKSLVIKGRPAVRYDIEKKPAAATFVNQSVWRNDRHIVTDIRVSDSNSSVFYVIASRPDLDPAVYESFLQSLQLN